MFEIILNRNLHEKLCLSQAVCYQKLNILIKIPEAFKVFHKECVENETQGIVNCSGSLDAADKWLEWS